VETDRNPTLQ